MPISMAEYKEKPNELSYSDDNYEITEKDIQCCATSDYDIKYKDFEKAIDIFEKLLEIEGDSTFDYLGPRFFEVTGYEYKSSINEEILEFIHKVSPNIQTNLLIVLDK